MDSLDIAYDVVPSRLNEKSIRNLDPRELVRLLSEAKAREVGSRCPGAVVVGGDLVVACCGKIYEKPTSLKEASMMLKSFSDSTVEVVSGLAVYDSSRSSMLSEVSVCELQFRKLDDSEIEAYVHSNSVLNFAGAFHVIGARMFSTGKGDVSVLNGIQKKTLIGFLRKSGFVV